MCNTRAERNEMGGIGQPEQIGRQNVEEQDVICYGAGFSIGL